MNWLVNHGWILGLLCLLAGGWHIYLYFSGTGGWVWVHLFVGLFTLGAGIFNLVMHIRLRRLKKQ